MKKALNKSRKGREVLHDFQLCILGFLRLRCIGLSVPVHGDHVGSTDEKSVEKLRLQYGRISGGNGVFYLSHGKHDPLLFFFALIMAIPVIDQMRRVWQNGH